MEVMMHCLISCANLYISKAYDQGTSLIRCSGNWCHFLKADKKHYFSFKNEIQDLSFEVLAGDYMQERHCSFK